MINFDTLNTLFTNTLNNNKEVGNIADKFIYSNVPYDITQSRVVYD